MDEATLSDRFRKLRPLRKPQGCRCKKIYNFKITIHFLFNFLLICSSDLIDANSTYIFCKNVLTVLQNLSKIYKRILLYTVKYLRLDSIIEYKLWYSLNIQTIYKTYINLHTLNAQQKKKKKQYNICRNITNLHTERERERPCALHPLLCFSLRFSVTHTLTFKRKCLQPKKKKKKTYNRGLKSCSVLSLV